MWHLDTLREAPATVVTDTGPSPAAVTLAREWSGRRCRSRLVNGGHVPVRVQEVILCTVAHALPGETQLYGEGFQMASQTGGTLGRPVDLGYYTDRGHYKIPQPPDAGTVYGLLTLSPPAGGHILLAFTSCRRFSGKFYLRERSIDIVVDTEGLSLEPGATWDLEEFLIATGPDRNGLLAELCEGIHQNHPPLRSTTVPTGWCSWYAFGPDVTAQRVLAHLDLIARKLPALHYVQIDDGYQAAMGDWLEPAQTFDGHVPEVLDQIRRQGFAPGLWVAPFIAEENARVFRDHPDWFVQDAEGQPLDAGRVTFGAWRRGPWYVLDGTHPEVLRHFETLFRTLHQEWGCSYFKLDALFWGAIHGGRFHDPQATRIEAYRRGLAAIRRGAGDSFVLGGNHPLWPSFGLLHGSRSSMDIARDWDHVAHIARENLCRAWQHGRLWWNDPDVVVLTGELSDDEFRFHATTVYAMGGLLFSGDDLTRLGPDRLALLRQLVPPTGVAATFEDAALRIGCISLQDRFLICLLNWDERPQTLAFRLPEPCRLRDFWTGQDLGRQEGVVTIPDLPRHSARLLECRPLGKSLATEG